MDNTYPLWTESTPFPSRELMVVPQGAVDVMVHRAGEDQYGFLHDTAIVSHTGVLFAAWYNCPEKEIAGESLIRGRRSVDGGLTWSEPEVIAADRDNRGVYYVPAVFLSHQGTLYAFVSNMAGHDLVTRCEVFVLDEGRGRWETGGFVAGPFLPNCAPVPMADGNFVMAGRMARRPGEHPRIPAVAISAGVGLTATWTVIPVVSPGTCRYEVDLPYPETTVIVNGTDATAIVRNDRGNALVFLSRDYCRTWSGPFQHNLPIGASKVYAGTLSTGQRYMISNTPTRGYRDLLTIAVTKAGSEVFARAWKLRDGHSAALGTGPEWSYPCAIEHEGMLYVAYTSEKRHCVLTRVHLSSLSVGDPPSG
jgi:hypothetical protein